MNRLEWRHHLQGLIALLAVSITFLTYGCAGLNQKSSSFHAEYYAGKNLTNADVVALREYAASSNNNVSSSASLVLGIYYLRYGEKNYGKYLVNKFFNSKELDPTMRLLGQLWHMEVLALENDTEGVNRIYNSISSGIVDENFKKVFTIYCSNENIQYEDMATAKLCMNKRIGKQADLKAFVDNNGTVIYDNFTQTQSLYDNMTYEEYLATLDSKPSDDIIVAKDATINVIGGDIMGEVVNGMIYAIQKLNAEFKISSLSEEAAQTLDFKSDEVYLRISDMEIVSDKRIANIAINWQEIAKTITLMKMIDRYQNIAISSDLNKLPFARYIKSELESKNSNFNIKVFNYEHPNFQANLRAYLDAATNGRTLLLGLGSEEDLMKFLPIAKYLVSTPETQKIMLVMSSISNNYLTSDYKSYFKEVEIITPIELINYEKFKEMNLEYSTIFGKGLTIKNLLGYDAISYINSLTNSETDVDYLTNITEFIDGIAHRSINRYRFNKFLVLDQLPLDLHEEVQEEVFIEPEATYEPEIIEITPKSEEQIEEEKNEVVE